MMNPTIKITADVDVDAPGARSFRLADMMSIAGGVVARLDDGPVDGWRLCEVGYSEDLDVVTVRASVIVAESRHAAVLDWLQDKVDDVDRVVLAPAVA